MRHLCILFVAGCAQAPVADTDDTETDAVDTAPVVQAVPWDRRLPVAQEAARPPRDLVALRGVFHLHSPFSHDACDGRGFEEGKLDTACLDDLRRGLCDTRFDVAFLTDHPDYGDAQTFEGMFHPREGDTWVREGDAVGRLVDCGDGQRVLWRVGFEDELMPVGLDRHVDEDQATRHELLNQSDAQAVAAMQAAGGKVMLAHTEGRDLDKLKQLQDEGLHAVEVFNLHAMLGPDIRKDDLGLEPFGWLEDAGAFLQEGDVEPDLLILAALQAQPPSLARFDALIARGPMMATGGTDAHQNVLKTPMRDGERGDSYRRMLRWFSTTLLARGTSLTDVDEAVAARRAYVAFEILGTPSGLDFRLDAPGGVVEMGGEGAPGTLVMTCPKLAAASPRGLQEPEVTVRVIRDGQVWQEGCGSWEAGPGAYRAEVEMVPRHLADFLVDAPELAERAYPWVYTGAIRVVE